MQIPTKREGKNIKWIMQKSVAGAALKWWKGQWNRKAEYVVQMYRPLKVRTLYFKKQGSVASACICRCRLVYLATFVSVSGS